MAEEVLDFLRVSFARLNERIDRIEADMAEFRERLGHIEGQIDGIYGMYAPCRRAWTAWTAARNASSGGST
jgi:hypothetical protein